MDTYQTPTVTTFSDPERLESESGLTADQLLALAEKENWQRREIAGRWWIGKEEYRRWLAGRRPG